MLLYQGAAALELWSGRPAPAAVMRAALLEKHLWLTPDSDMEGVAVSFLDGDGVCLWRHRGEFSQCLHPPDAAGAKHRPSALALSALRLFHSVVFEHPAVHLDLAGRAMRPLQGAHFSALFIGGTAHGGALRGLLDRLRPPSPRCCPLAYAILIAGLIVGSFIDLEHLIIPDQITYGGMAAGLFCSFLVPQMHLAFPGFARLSTPGAGLADSFLGLAVGAGVIYGILRAGKFFLGRQKVESAARHADCLHGNRRATARRRKLPTRSCFTARATPSSCRPFAWN